MFFRGYPFHPASSTGHLPRKCDDQWRWLVGYWVAHGEVSLSEQFLQKQLIQYDIIIIMQHPPVWACGLDRFGMVCRGFQRGCQVHGALGFE
jgi:hypothetical protein